MPVGSANLVFAGSFVPTVVFIAEVVVWIAVVICVLPAK